MRLSEGEDPLHRGSQPAVPAPAPDVSSSRIGAERKC